MARDAWQSPNLIFADCNDLDSAIHGSFWNFFNQGEVCSANSRLLVERSVQNEFVERLASIAKDTTRTSSKSWF